MSSSNDWKMSKRYSNDSDDDGVGGFDNLDDDDVSYSNDASHEAATVDSNQPQHHFVGGSPNASLPNTISKRSSAASSFGGRSSGGRYHYQHHPSDVAHRAAIAASAAGDCASGSATFKSPLPPAGAGGISRAWMSSPTPTQSQPLQHHEQQYQQAPSYYYKTPRRQLDFIGDSHGHHHHDDDYDGDDEQQTSGEPSSSTMSTTSTTTGMTTLRRGSSFVSGTGGGKPATVATTTSKGRTCPSSFGSTLMIIMALSCSFYVLMAVKLVGNTTTIEDFIAKQIVGDEPTILSVPIHQEHGYDQDHVNSRLSSKTDGKTRNMDDDDDDNGQRMPKSTSSSSSSSMRKTATSETKSKLRSSSGSSSTTTVQDKQTNKSTAMKASKVSKDTGSDSSSSSSSLSLFHQSTKTTTNDNESSSAPSISLSKKRIEERDKTEKKEKMTSAATTTKKKTTKNSSTSSTGIMKNLQNKTLITPAKTTKATKPSAAIPTTSVKAPMLDVMNDEKSRTNGITTPSTTTNSSLSSGIDVAVIEVDNTDDSMPVAVPSQSLPPVNYKAAPRVVGLIVRYETTGTEGEKYFGNSQPSSILDSIYNRSGGSDGLSVFENAVNYATRMVTASSKYDGPYHTIGCVTDLTDKIFQENRRKRISDIQASIIRQQKQQDDKTTTNISNNTDSLSNFQPSMQSLDVYLFDIPPLSDDYEVDVPAVTDISDKETMRAHLFNATGQMNGSNARDIDQERGGGDVNDEKQDTCQPMAAWMTSSFVNCNTIHEIDLLSGAMREGGTDVQLLGQGWFRSAWRYTPTSTEPVGDEENEAISRRPLPPLILKTLRIEREFLEEYFELHRRDAVAMERLTSSPFVMDVYGYCGQSALNEFAEGIMNGEVNSLEQLNRRMRGRETDEKTLKLKLQLAVSVALGLAHVHNVNVDSTARIPSVTELLYDIPGNANTTTTGFQKSMATMAHYDINPRNIAIMRDGKPKLNDFNIAEFLQYKSSKNDDGTDSVQSCGFRSRLHEPWWRAPEEMNTNITEFVMVREKVDVYALGNVLYHILTTHSPRGKMKKERMDEVRTLVRAGVPPVLTEPFASNPGLKKHRIVKAFVRAMDLCFAMDPNERGTSIDVARVLHQALQREKEREQTHPEQHKSVPEPMKKDKRSIKKPKTAKKM